ncbi:Uncharacterised protein [uncultured archaeon]|nr:Uncharacterised protein [uncultured archaeon]
MKLYHRTTEERAGSILRRGFKDGAGRYMTEASHEGVWLSDRPLDSNEGAWGDTLLEVSLDLEAKDLDPYEWVEEGKSYREWFIPATIVNAKGKCCIVDDED